MVNNGLETRHGSRINENRKVDTVVTNSSGKIFGVIHVCVCVCDVFFAELDLQAAKSKKRINQKHHKPGTTIVTSKF